MNVSIGAENLSERVDVVVGGDNGIQRVDTSLWVIGGMSSFPEKLHLEFDSTKKVQTQNVTLTQMENHRRIDLCNLERFTKGGFSYIPENVKLCESPGSAGGLAKC
jgi:hypothetical protein